MGPVRSEIQPGSDRQTIIHDQVLSWHEHGVQEAFKGRLGLTLDLMGKVMEIEGSIPEGSVQETSGGFALVEDKESLEDFMDRFNPGDAPACHIAMSTVTFHRRAGPCEMMHELTAHSQ